MKNLAFLQKLWALIWTNMKMRNTRDKDTTARDSVPFCLNTRHAKWDSTSCGFMIARCPRSWDQRDDWRTGYFLNGSSHDVGLRKYRVTKKVSFAGVWRMLSIRAGMEVGSVTGNPGVFQGNPHPYPWKPVPACMGTGFHGYRSWVFSNPWVPIPYMGYQL